MVVESVTGLVPPKWELTTLGDVCRRSGGSIQTGPFGSQLHAADYVPAGVPSIMPVNIGENRIVPDGIARITEADAQRLSRHRVIAGDIVYSRRGDVERRALIRTEEQGWLCGTGCLRVRLGDKAVDPLFASYYLAHPSVRAWLVRHAVGVTMPNLNTAIMGSIPFLVPPHAEQKTIAHTLGTLDDKIELNRRMNRTLEAIARAIFKSWFVDFDPVKAKSEGRQPPGLDAKTAALFPDSFQDSPLGPIPTGWSVRRWGEIASLEYGKRLSGYADATGPYRVYGTNGAIGWHTEPLCPTEGIIIGRKGAYRGVHYSPNPFFVIDTAFHLKLASTCSVKWAYFEIRTHDINDMDSGSAIPSTSRDAFYALPVCWPSQPILDAFERLAVPLFSRQYAGHRESQTLAAIRDALLPNLLSGEIRVGQAEKIAEEVA